MVDTVDGVEETIGEIHKVGVARRGPRPTPLRDLRNLSNTEDLEFIYQDKNNVVHRLDLPVGIHDAVLTYLKKRSQGELDKLWFDCYTFACLSKGMPPPTIENGVIKWGKISDHWKMVEVTDTLEAGDVFFFHSLKENFDFKHAAVYIGHGLFLSVFGIGGELEVTSYDQIMKLWGADGVFKMEPVAKN